MSEEENEALIDFEREVEDGRLLKSDIILSLDTGIIMLDLIKKQQAKIKGLEKGNRSLMESRIKWKNRYYKEKAKNKEYISKDKIRQKIKEVQETVCPNCCACGLCDEFKELLEEN